MTPSTLVLRSLVFHWRSHLGVLLGVAVGTAVLAGALIVGDSVKHTLHVLALSRLGSIELALHGRDRFFREELAERLSDSLSATVAPTLELRGTVRAPDTNLRANRAVVRGVDSRFWELEDDPSIGIPNLSEGVALNQRLAAHLNVKVGQEVLLRVENPSHLSREAPLSTLEDQSVASRFRIEAIVSDSGLGGFDLGASQIAPYNVFVPLERLQEEVDQTGRANLLLVGGQSDLSLEKATLALRERWRLTDAAHRVRELPEKGVLELMTDRIFLDAPIAAAARKTDASTQGILTYFVNELRVGEKTTPYSIVSALEPAPTDREGTPRVVPPDLGDNELVINDWLARDLDAGPGDSVQLGYYVLGPKRQLIEEETTLVVRWVVPIEGAAYDPDLMPPYPGLHDSENCRDWDPGFPMELGTIRDLDEAYWDEYRGTPKAFLNLFAGQKLWRNRFGNLTAIRIPAHGRSVEALETSIREKVDPASLGFFFTPIRASALAASSQALPFGPLFLGFSFFLIVAALLLVGLLFVFGVELRAGEIGTLLAVGYRPKQVRRLLLSEGILLALFGGLAGTLLGFGYAWGILQGLGALWSGAVGETTLFFHASPWTVGWSLVSGILICVLTVWMTVRKQAGRPARLLLGVESGTTEEEAIGGKGRAARNYLTAAVTSALGLLLIATSQGQAAKEAAATFFGAGALLLIATIAVCRGALIGMERSRSFSGLSLASIARSNGIRRRGRSLAIIGLLACGSFLVIAVGANRHSALEGAELRSSGTGGFAFIGESALPVYHDLNSESGLNHYGLSQEDLPGVSVVPLRIRKGDDASCLNLNRAQTPQILGVDPESLKDREAFSFVAGLGGDATDSPWSLLEKESEPGTLPAIADNATVQWALGKKVGDRLDYVDERGTPFQVQIVGTLANSILQGNVLISESRFNDKFPSNSGYRMFLIDAPDKKKGEIRETLSSALVDVGLDLVPAAQRLADFNTVENTYLAIFQALGALGLLLGSVGLGVVVLRTVLERRAELAVLRAVGFSAARVRRLIFLEQGWLLVLGLGCGIASGLVTVIPTVLARGSEVPYGSLSLTLVALVASGLLWIWLATWFALEGPLLAALRNE